MHSPMTVLAVPFQTAAPTARVRSRSITGPSCAISDARCARTALG